MKSVHFYVLLLCLVDKSCLILCGPMDYSPPGSSVLGILQAREYWSGLPFPFSGDLPNPGIELASPALADRFFTAEPPVKLQKSGLIVIVPLICTLTIQGQYPVLSHPESPQGAPFGGRWLQWLMACSGSYFSLELPWGSPWGGELQCDDLMRALSFVY